MRGMCIHVLVKHAGMDELFPFDPASPLLVVAAVLVTRWRDTHFETIVGFLSTFSITDSNYNLYIT